MRGFVVKGGVCERGLCVWGLCGGVVCMGFFVVFGGWRGLYLIRYLPARFAVFTNRRTRA